MAEAFQEREGDHIAVEIEEESRVNSTKPSSSFFEEIKNRIIAVISLTKKGIINGYVLFIILVTVVSIGNVFVAICFPHLLKKAGLGEISEKNLMFIPEHQIAHQEMYGNEALLEKTVDKILDIVKFASGTPREQARAYTYPNFRWILHGQSGTGKTLFVTTLIRKVEEKLKEIYGIPKKTTPTPSVRSNEKVASWCYFKKVEYQNIYSYYYGTTEKNLDALMKTAAEVSLIDDYSCAFLFFDEADGIFFPRKFETNSYIQRTSNTVLDLFKDSEIDGSFKRVFVFAATNYVSKVDEAMRRRFINDVKFDYPDFDTRKELIEKTLSGCELEDALVNDLATITNDLAHAYITDFLRDCSDYDSSGRPIYLHVDEFKKKVKECKKMRKDENKEDLLSKFSRRHIEQ